MKENIKQSLLKFLAEEARWLTDNVRHDKVVLNKLWERCDKDNPETAQWFSRLNNLRDHQRYVVKRLKRIESYIKELKND